MLPPPSSGIRKSYLVAGGNGFIGSHLAARLYQQGHFVRVVDIAPPPTSSNISPGSTTFFNEFIEGNLCDVDICRAAVSNIEVVIHLAANMGGMGVIHKLNDMQIYRENHTMTLNLLEASIAAGVKQFFYASSACVYPEQLQLAEHSSDVSLREADVFGSTTTPPRPQGLYGLEKLVSELILDNQLSDIDIRIARFHNIFGPGGAWMNGREKVPAAVLRKAFICAILGTKTFEIWGDGTQRRSFLFIDDAVDAVIRLLQSECRDPVNIGSSHSVTIQELANMALGVAGVSPETVEFIYSSNDRPVGVAARNSNNEFATKSLGGWEPRISLEEGMRETGVWIKNQIQQFIILIPATPCGTNTPGNDRLELLQHSEVITLDSQIISFAILLPVTSRAGGLEKCLDNLRRFSTSLLETTWRDRHAIGHVQYKFTIYLALDEVDTDIRGTSEMSTAEKVLRDAGIVDIVTLILNHPKGHVCALWRDCAKKAWEDGCDYFVLMGDDVEILDEGWMRKVHTRFLTLASEQTLPFGLGCVTFTDISFPGMPTFPIINRWHMDTFGGQVIPELFINQDGDPYLFQLYRRWATSIMLPCRIQNSIGGSSDARYEKESVDWKYGALDEGVSTVEARLQTLGLGGKQLLSIDIVVPSFRVQSSYLDGILSLKPSTQCTTMFIIIIDDPSSPMISAFESKYSIRPDIRIRVNKRNVGASASRNRGIKESSADWILFLDDDIIPKPHTLLEAESLLLTLMLLDS